MRIPRLPRWAWRALALLALHTLARALFLAVSGDEGLLTPGGGVRVGVVLLGLSALLLRIAVLWLIPPLLAFHLVNWTISRWRG